MFVLDFKISNPIEAMLIFGILPFPATLDWFTQTMRWRESVNLVRVLTGFLYGVSTGVCLGNALKFNMNVLLVAIPTYSAYIAIVIWLLRKHQVLRNYLAPYEQFLSVKSDSEYAKLIIDNSGIHQSEE